MLQQILGVSPALPQRLPAVVQCLRNCRVLQGVLAVANGPRGMAPHLVLQTPGMPSPYMQVRPECLQAGTAGSWILKASAHNMDLNGLVAVTLHELPPSWAGAKGTGWVMLPCQNEGSGAAIPQLCSRGMSYVRHPLGVPCTACLSPGKVLEVPLIGAMQMRPPGAQQQLRPQAQQGTPAHRPALQQPPLLQSAPAAPVS